LVAVVAEREHGGRLADLLGAVGTRSDRHRAQI
jgi:hypothetical protein